MKTMINVKGNSIRQSKINDGCLLMKHQLKKDPSYRDNFYLWEFGIDTDSFIHKPIKLFNEKYSSANGFTIEYNILIDEKLLIGDILFDKKENIYWICTESYNRDDILCAGKLTRCNYWLRWQDDNGKIYDYPVFEINSTQYNSGESGDKTITLGSSQHLITITADKNTIPLNHGKRVFWGKNTSNPTVFKVTQNDTTAMNYDKGLLKITVMEDQYNPKTDSIENWLCDYFQTSTITILYSGNSPTIRVGGTKILKVDTTDTVEWSISNDIGATIISDENSVKVKCPQTPDCIGKTISIVAKLSNGSSGECILTVAGGV
jgi:hypothetical protein